MKMTRIKIYSSIFTMCFCLNLGALGMDQGPSTPSSFWGKLSASVSEIGSSLRDSTTHTMTQAAAHLKFSMASKVDYGSSVPAVNAFLKQEIVKEGFQVRELQRTLTEEEFNSLDAGSLSFLYVYVQRNNIALLLQKNLFMWVCLR
jgi:hypothetical protein